MSNNELFTIARRINDREKVIEQLRSKTETVASTVVAEALLQGCDLLAAKAQVKFGEWESWLRAHCPRSIRNAQRYMRLAMNHPRIAEGTNSLRAALALCETNEEHDKGEPKRWPAYIQAIGRLGKLSEFVEHNPISNWPVEGRDKFKEDLEPLARQLWPERWENR
jgi:hypothetical protein